MTASDCDFWVATDRDGDAEGSEALVELVLLLHGGQFSALERLAGARGISVGRLLRQVIRDYLARELGAAGSQSGTTR